MDRGRIYSHETLEVALIVDPGTVDDGCTASGVSYSLYEEPTFLQTVLGIDLYSTVHNSAGTYSRTADLSLDGFAPITGWTGSGLASVTSVLKFLNPRLDVLKSGLWRFSFSDIEWYVEGGLQWSFGGSGTIDSATLNPNSVPLFGVPPTMATGCAVPFVPTDPPTLSISNSQTLVEVEVSGGWKFTDGGIDTAFTVDLDQLGLVVPDACSCGIGTPGAATATDTNSATLTGFARVYTTYEITDVLDCDCPPGCTQVGQPQYNEITSTAGYEHSSTQVTLVPDFAKSIKRWQDKAGDYRAAWMRWEMPETVRDRLATCTTGDSPTDPGTTDSKDSGNVTHPRQSQILSVVGEDPHAIEDTLGYRTLAPFGVTYAHHKSESKTYEFIVGSGHCIVGIDCGGLAPCFEDTYFYCLLDSREGIGGSELGHSLPILTASSATAGYAELATYCDTWACPHWSYVYFIDDWDVLGSTGFWVDYWGKIGSQWLYNAALPVDEQRSTRNSILESPLETSPLAASQTSNYGGRWLGISRFDTEFVEIPLSVAMTSASSPAWSATGATLGHGASITVTPSGLTVVVEYDIGRTDAAPYEYSHLADSVGVNWSGAHIDSVSIEGVSADGSSVVTLGTATGDLALIAGSDLKYAGSWAQAEGVGWITDTGFDDGPNVASGESSTVMADAERAVAFSYLRERQPAVLRFTFHLNSTAAFTLDYPLFKRSDVDPVFSRESRKVTDLLWTDGPGLRFGALEYGDGSGSASVSLEGTKTSVVDILCWIYEWLEGVSRAGLGARVAAAFDSTEGNTVIKAGTDTHALILPQTGRTGSKSSLTCALVNTLREVPPMWVAPVKARDSVTFLATGAYVLEVFSFAQEPMRYVCPGGTPLVFEDPVGTAWTSPEAGWPSGWSVSSHVHAVDNNEGYGYVRFDGATVGRHRPWRGVFAVLGATSVGAVSYDVSDSVSHARAIITGGLVTIGFASNSPLPLVWADMATSVAADWVCLRWMRRSHSQQLILAVEDGGEVLLYGSLDRGVSWTLLEDVGPGTKPTLATDEDGKVFLYWLHSGDVKGKVYDQTRAAIVSTFTACSGDDQGVAAYAQPGSLGSRQIVLLTVSGSDIKRQVSGDGVTFGAASTVGTGKKPSAHQGKSGRHTEAWIDGSNLVARLVDRTGAEVLSPQIVAACDDTGHQVCESPGPVGQWREVCEFAGSGTASQKYSFDGSIWT